jgi:hypothetical protein
MLLPAPGLPGATWCGWPARSYSRCCASKSGRIFNPAQRLLAQLVCTAANNVTEVINTACIHYQKLPAARPLGIGGNAGQTTERIQSDLGPSLPSWRPMRLECATDRR